MSEIEYNLKSADLLAFGEFDWQQSEKIQNSLKRHRTLWPLVLLAVGIFFLLILGRADTTLRFGLLAIAWAVFVPRLVRMYFRRRCVKASASPEWLRLVGRHRLELDGASLVTTTPDDQISRILPGDVQRLEDSDKHFFLYLNSGGALVMPKDAIKPRILERFVKKIRSRFLADQGEPNTNSSSR